MDGNSERLRGAAAREAAAAVASLAAAERAVNEGHLNTAKVFRAASLAARQRSLALMRAASFGEALTTTLDQAARAAGHTLETIEGGDSATAELDAVLRSASTSAVIVGAALASLAAGRDVPESLVAQMLFVCEDWRRKVDLVSGRTLAVDVASWVANHNVAHLRQIDALLNQ